MEGYRVFTSNSSLMRRHLPGACGHATGDAVGLEPDSSAGSSPVPAGMRVQGEGVGCDADRDDSDVTKPTFS